MKTGAGEEESQGQCCQQGERALDLGCVTSELVGRVHPVSLWGLQPEGPM